MWRAVASIRMLARVDASGRRPVPRPAVGWPRQLPSAARLRRSLKVCASALFAPEENADLDPAGDEWLLTLVLGA